MIGGSLFYDFARVGATPAPFQSFVLSAGVVTDYVYGAGMHWQGGCGGFRCDGSGSLNEWNVIGELKAATPLGGGNTLNGYIGAGAAIFWPSGHPTGGTTSFLGSATAPAVRIERRSRDWSMVASLRLVLRPYIWRVARGEACEVDAATRHGRLPVVRVASLNRSGRLGDQFCRDRWRVRSDHKLGRAR